MSRGTGWWLVLGGIGGRNGCEDFGCSWPCALDQKVGRGAGGVKLLAESDEFVLDSFLSPEPLVLLQNVLADLGLGRAA